MPRIDPDVLSRLELRAPAVTTGFELHDAWCVALDGAGPCSIPLLRERIRSAPPGSVGLPVRALFGVRRVLGAVFRLDARPRDAALAGLAGRVPADLRAASLVAPGTPEGPFDTLYLLEREAAYEAYNATVHAVLVVAVEPTGDGHRFYWATYLRPVGRITRWYMRLIDPFRRLVVYPGLERWLRSAWNGRPTRRRP